MTKRAQLLSSNAIKWFLVTMIMTTPVFASTSASAYNGLTMGGGPVLSPDIVPFFWGNWTSGDNSHTDRVRIRAYIDGFASYISGQFNPVGQEPTVRQYGVWGASRVSGDFFIGKGSDTHIRNTGIYQRIQLLQSENKLPPNTPNRVFIVFLRGFTYDFTDDTGYDSADCAYHSLNNGTYYAVVPMDYTGNPQCNEENNNPLFEQMASHELQESMTDPYLWNGWVTNEGIGGYTHNEGGDECESANTTLTFSDGHGGTQPGTVQTFADNFSASCTSFTASTTSHIGLGLLVGSTTNVVDAFFPFPSGGSLGHVTLNTDYTFTNETIQKPGVAASGPLLLYTPSVVSTAVNRFDVFVRGSDGVLNQVTRKTATGAWKFSTMTSSALSLGQASAAETGQDHIDLVVQNMDSSVGHYSWTDTGSVPAPTSLGGQSIGPPTIVARGSASLLDVFTFGMHADVVENTSTNGTFGGYHTLVGGSNDNIPFPPAPVWWDNKHEDVYMPGGGNSVVTRFNSSWSGNWVGFGSPPSATLTHGALAVARNWQQTGEYDVVWLTKGGSYSAIHVSNNGSTWGPVTDLGSPDPGGPGYFGPPAVIYGSDGFPYVFGIGDDSCLYATSVDWWSGGGPSNPTWTGVCGLI